MFKDIAMVGWWEGVICRQHQGPHLPPIVVVFADYLQDVPSVEGDPRLGRQLSNHRIGGQLKGRKRIKKTFYYYKIKTEILHCPFVIESIPQSIP